MTKLKTRLLLFLILLLITPGCERDKPMPPSAKGDSDLGKQEQEKANMTGKAKLLTLSFPQMPLEPGERIIGFEIIITSGSVRSVNNIPRGWSVRLDSELSWKPVLSGRIHHGVEALMDFSELQSLALVEPDPSNASLPPFNVEAKLFTTINFESTTTKSFKTSDLLLSPSGG